MADRLISADALKDFTTNINSIWNIIKDSSGRGLDEIIDSLPTIEAEPVIHCKDCKYYEAKQKGKPWKVSREYCGRTITLNMNPNDFCSRGERMDENAPCSKSVRGSTDSRMAVQGDTTVGAKMDEVEDG